MQIAQGSCLIRCISLYNIDKDRVKLVGRLNYEAGAFDDSNTRTQGMYIELDSRSMSV